jgi:2-polyprenyl-6-methoxyphenol hydroxylase-like FAD-dependent oxidoreductase
VNESFDTDVLIAGGGPAGLAAAIAARHAGLTVMLADPDRPPIDKACGEGIMPAGIAALRQLGIELLPGQFSALAGMRFVDAHGAVDAVFPHGRGCGVRRTTLHQAMVERAEQAGVELLWGSRVSFHPRLRNHNRGWERASGKEGILLDGRGVRCRWLIGADGQNSRLRAQAGLDGPRGVRRRFGFRCHYATAPRSEFVEVHWGEHGQMYVTPVACDQVCVALLTHGPNKPNTRLLASAGRAGDPILDEARAHFPAVAARLEGARRLTRMRGSLTVTRSLPLVWRENLALIGEASGSVDAITGEGLTMAFQQALALAAALAAGDLRLYQAAHRRIMRRPNFMNRLLLNMDRHASLRQRVLRAFCAEPGLFARMLAIHVGESSCLGVRGTVSLGWRLLGLSRQAQIEALPR